MRKRAIRYLLPSMVFLTLGLLTAFVVLSKPPPAFNAPFLAHAEEIFSHSELYAPISNTGSVAPTKPNPLIAEWESGDPKAAMVWSIFSTGATDPVIYRTTEYRLNASTKEVSAMLEAMPSGRPHRPVSWGVINSTIPGPAESKFVVDPNFQLTEVTIFPDLQKGKTRVSITRVRRATVSDQIEALLHNAYANPKPPRTIAASP